MRRRKSINPQTVVSKITKPSQIKNVSCARRTENEQNALLKYYEYKHEINKHVALSATSVLVVNPMCKHEALCATCGLAVNLMCVF